MAVNICKLNWKFWLGLCWVIKSAAGKDFSSCKCIPIKECVPFTRLLLKHSPSETHVVYSILQNASCGFAGLDRLACCPENTESKIILDAQDLLKSLTLTMQHRRFSRGSHMSSSGMHKHHLLETDIFDFKDVKTQRNFPHSFYEEIDNIAHSMQHKKQHPHFFSPPNFKFVGHNHFPHDTHPLDSHEMDYDAHDHYHFPHFGFDDDNTDRVVYPDDKILNRPLIFPAVEMPTTIKPQTSSQTEPKQHELSNVNMAGCGVPLVDPDTGERNYPWITRIAYLNKTNNRINYRCSGSVVSRYHILTAAHCVVNLVNELELSHVRIGTVTAATNCTSDCGVTPQTYQITQISVHPNYDQPKYANDLALLRILSANNEPNFTAICLPPKLSVPVMDKLIGTTGIALGWSADGEGNESNNPKVKYITLPIVNTTECAITYAKFSENFQDQIVITPSQLCAQGSAMNDVCRGDSGGPFMDDGSTGLINSSGRHSLLGIVAFGPTKCGDSNIPGVYTRVNSYLEWILETIA